MGDIAYSQGSVVGQGSGMVHSSGCAHMYELQPGDGTRYRWAVMPIEDRTQRYIVGGIDQGEWVLFVPLSPDVGVQGLYRIDRNVAMHEVEVNSDIQNHWSQFLIASLLPTLSYGVADLVRTRARYIVNTYYPSPMHVLEEVNRTGVSFPVYSLRR